MKSAWILQKNGVKVVIPSNGVVIAEGKYFVSVKEGDKTASFTFTID